ncbi:MAG TPA: ABC transporter substrate-binding protein [Usitatibacter sp.]|nr:ABC transporter substrate-binding protein [Usitatibacter sp.]
MRFELKLLAAIPATALAAGAAQAQISGNEVKIGVLSDMSSLYADIGGPGSLSAAKMAVEDFQKAHHPKFKIEVVGGDHLNKPDVGSQIARKWYDEEGVDAIVDVPNSGVALAISQITREKNKAFLASGPGTSDLTGSKCSPNTIHWVYDTWMLANGTGTAVVKQGGDSWFFITADYAFGHALERDTSNAVKKAGGKVLGDVKVPLNTQDFSSFLLQAQASKAKIIGLANAGGDTINSIKQASEFGITKAGQKMAGLLVFLSDIHGIGLEKAQGLVLTGNFYWDLNDKTRAWSKRWSTQNNGRMPTMVHAGVYSSVLEYLNAVAAINSDDGGKVIAQMKKKPFDDPLFGKSHVREDGRNIHDAYLFQVKSPSESKGPYDYYKVLATIPGEEAFRPLKDGGCSLVK